MEQVQQRLVVAAGVAVVEHESLQFGLAVEPAVWSPAEQFGDVVEVGRGFGSGEIW